MSCLCLTSIVFNLIYIAITIGYPLTKAYESVKSNQPSRLYIAYFFILGVVFFLESTVLIPVKLLLDAICLVVYPSIKALVCLWLIHPDYRGALFIDQKAEPLVSKYINLLNSKIGSVTGILGFPNRV